MLIMVFIYVHNGLIIEYSKMNKLALAW